MDIAAMRSCIAAITLYPRPQALTSPSSLRLAPIM